MTIIGHGDIASVLAAADRTGLTFFAAGVSNSSETRESEYRREFDLLYDTFEQRHFVYFSSLCVFYSDTQYARHKCKMERIVRNNFNTYTILRLGNITWGTNPHTLINFLRARRAAGLPLEIQDTWRYVVDRDEFLHWVNMIPPWSCEMNIPGRRMKVADIVREYVIGEPAYA